MVKSYDRVATHVYDPLPFDVGALIRLLFVGVFTGVAGWLLYMAISQYFIVPVFCRSAEAFAVCSNGGTIAWIAGHVIALGAALALLARMSIYRPLLVILAVLATLWSAHAWLGGLVWYQGLAWQAVLFALAFALFGWLARATSFVAVLIATIALVVLFRFILMWA